MHVLISWKFYRKVLKKTQITPHMLRRWLFESLVFSNKNLQEAPTFFLESVSLSSQAMRLRQKSNKREGDPVQGPRQNYWKSMLLSCKNGIGQSLARLKKYLQQFLYATINYNNFHVFKSAIFRTIFWCNLPSIESGLQPGLEEATEVTVIYNRGQKALF